MKLQFTPGKLHIFVSCDSVINTNLCFFSDYFTCDCNEWGVNQENPCGVDGTCNCRTDNGEPRPNNPRCVSSSMPVNLLLFLSLDLFISYRVVSGSAH